jgi:hypothetical protein
MAIVMTATRQRIEIDANFMAEFGSLLHYQQACDGVWVPVCDLAQYEAGRRPWA